MFDTVLKRTLTHVHDMRNAHDGWRTLWERHTGYESLMYVDKLAREYRRNHPMFT